MGRISGAASMTDELQADLAAIRRIGAVPTMLDVVCRVTGMGFAAIARVTEDRWVACSVRDELDFGLQPGSELPLQTTICDEIRRSGEAVVIDHVAEDALFRNHHTPALYQFQSYISMPIMLTDGTFFGTLCALDTRPARVNTPETVGMFRLFAELIAFHLEANSRLELSELKLREANETAQLREQFIAVLGHDLRNPLAAIGAVNEVLLRTPLSERAAGLVRMARNSVTRMSGLIDNILDFARGRLGGGITLTLSQGEALEAVLRQVVEELQAAWPQRRIEVRIGDLREVTADPARIGQLLSNLLGNALTHGAAELPVRVEARLAGGEFRLSVANGGAPIPPAVQAQLFHPFFRGGAGLVQEGLGLGLYIASEIAAAHGGRLEVSTGAEETCFSFRMRQSGP